MLSSEGLKLSIYCQFFTWEKSCKFISRGEGMEFQGFFAHFVLWFISLFNKASCIFLLC